MPQSFYLMSSVWVPSSTAKEKCCKSRRWSEMEKGGKKARFRLAPQQLPTKAFTKRALHSTLCWHQTHNKTAGTGQDQAGLDTATGERQWRGRRRGAAHLISLASTPWLPSILLFSLASALTLEAEERISPARAAQWCQVSSESGEPMEANIYPSNCCSLPPAALQIYQCHHPTHLRSRPPELADSWGRFPESILAQMFMFCCW